MALHMVLSYSSRLGGTCGALHLSTQLQLVSGCSNPSRYKWYLGAQVQRIACMIFRTLLKHAALQLCFSQVVLLALTLF